MYRSLTQILTDARNRFYSVAIEGLNDLTAESHFYEIAQDLVDQKGQLHWEAEGVGPFNYLSTEEIAAIVASHPDLLNRQPEMGWVNPLPYDEGTAYAILLPVIYDAIVNVLWTYWDEIKASPNYVQSER